VPAWPQDRFVQAHRLDAQIKRYASALRRRWWIFVVSLVVVGGPILYFAMTRPPTFQSQALMWLTGQVNLPGGRLYAEELTSYVGTQGQLIKSPSILLGAFQKVRTKFPSIARLTANMSADRLPFDLNVRNSAKGSVLELRATGPEPEATQAFLDAVMEEYQAFKQEARKKTSSGALTSVTDQMREAEKQIQQQQHELTQFQMSNNISYLTEHGLSAGSHLAKLTELLSDLRTEYRLLELMTPAQFKGLAESPQVTMSDNTIPGQRAASALALNSAAPQTAYYQALQQVQLLKAKRDEFAQVLRPTHSKMVKLNQEIAGLEQLLKTLLDEGEQRALAQMANRKKSLELQIENLESQYKAWETNAVEASRKLAEYDRMKQELQRSQALYDRLSGLLQTMDLNYNMDREPLVPLAPASAAHPSLTKYRVAIEGILLALIVGGAAFLFLEFLDDRFTSAKELSLNLPVEVVGQIPEAGALNSTGLRRLLPAGDMQPAFAEAFRNLRSSLLFMSGQEAHPRVILVTSAVPNEGKTTVCSNLARTLAMSGSRVLLIDADYRRSSAHRNFGVDLKPGLVGVLSQEVSVDQAIVPTAEQNLFVLPAGECGDNSSDLFLRGRVDLLLRDVGQKFDYVLVDSAPVLATDDAACLGPHTDGAFMVVRASYTSSRMASEALERLNRRHVKVLGMVYNCAPKSSDYYYQYSSEYYGTGAPRPKSKSASPLKPKAGSAPSSELGGAEV
jgi:capsular exopolysaccharide synthesis family protein